MKRKLQLLAALAPHTTRRVRQALQWVSLAPVAFVLSRPAFAQSGGTSTIPTVTPPTTALGGGSVSTGDMLGEIGGFTRNALMYVAITLAVVGAIWAGFGVFSKWKLYSDGREDLQHFVASSLMAGVFVTIMIILATAAISYLG